MSEQLTVAVERFLTHRRALGRRYLSEQAELTLLVRFADARGVNRLDELTPSLLDEFLASRPRTRPRSFNHLLGVVAGLLDWTVAQELLPATHLRTRRRRTTADRLPFIFDPVQARWLLEVAANLEDNARAPARGATYRGIFALCYGLGLRGGEACGLRVGDIDVERGLLVVHGGKFGRSRLVPHGPRVGELLAEQLERRRAGRAVVEEQAPLFTFDGHRCVHSGSASQTFRHLVPALDLEIPDGVGSPRLHSLRHSFAVGTQRRGVASDASGRRGGNPRLALI